MRRKKIDDRLSSNQFKSTKLVLTFGRLFRPSKSFRGVVEGIRAEPKKSSESRKTHGTASTVFSNSAHAQNELVKPTGIIPSGF